MASESSPSLRHWIPFDNLNKPSSSSKPEALMVDIEGAIVTLEHSRATALLRPFHPTPPPCASGLADEAYKAGFAALAAGSPDAALRSLRVALVSCPPDRPSALSKIRSLVAFASIQHHRLSKSASFSSSSLPSS